MTGPAQSSRIGNAVWYLMAPPIPQGSDAFGIPNSDQIDLLGPPGGGTDRGFFDEFVEVYGFDDLTSTGDESEVGAFPLVMGTHEVGDGDVLACGVLAEVANAEAVLYFWNTSELGADSVSKVARWSGLNDMIGNEAVDMERIEFFLFDMLNEVGGCDGGLFRVGGMQGGMGSSHAERVLPFTLATLFPNLQHSLPTCGSLACLVLFCQIKNRVIFPTHPRSTTHVYFDVNSAG